jgi:hypothetical protein
MDQLANAARAAGFAMTAIDDDAGHDNAGYDNAGRSAAAIEADTATKDIYDALLASDISGFPAVATGLKSQFGGPSPKVVLSETLARWQGTSKPVALSDIRADRTSRMRGWLPSFNWRQDGR